MLLGKAGIDVNLARTADGATPLFVASQQGHPGVVELLLSKEAVDVNRAIARGPQEGCTPLSIACRKGHTDVVRRLLRRIKFCAANGRSRNSGGEVKVHSGDEDVDGELDDMDLEALGRDLGADMANGDILD